MQVQPAEHDLTAYAEHLYRSILSAWNHRPWNVNQAIVRNHLEGGAVRIHNQTLTP
jgi:hypothetical protein